MKIWLIGKGGMLGSSFIRFFEKNAIEYIATGKEVDVTLLFDLLQFAEGIEITHIVNCSGYTQVDLAEKEMEKAYLLNVEAIKNIAIVGNKLGAKVVHFSSDYVFSGYTNSPYLEEDQKEPLSIYGKTKDEGEKVLFAMQKEALLIRTSWLFGKSKVNFVKKMKELMLKENTLRVVSDQIGRPTYVEDLVYFSFLLFAKSGVFHIAGEGVTSWYAFAKKIHKEIIQLNQPLVCERIDPIATKDFFTLAKRPLYSVLDTQKTERTLQKKLPSWENGLKEYIGDLFEKV